MVLPVFESKSCIVYLARGGDTPPPVFDESDEL
jgi:hypothetical protein